MRGCASPSPNVRRSAASDSALSAQYEERVEVAGRQIVLRPIRPEDEPQQPASRDREARRLAAALLSCRACLRTFAARAIHADRLRPRNGLHRDRTRRQRRGRNAGSRARVSDPDGRAEFAILVRSDMQGKGLGALLMDKIVGIAVAAASANWSATCWRATVGCWHSRGRSASQG